MDSIETRRESNEIYKLSSEELATNVITNPNFPNQAVIEYSNHEDAIQGIYRQSIFRGYQELIITRFINPSNS